MQRCIDRGAAVGETGQGKAPCMEIGSLRGRCKTVAEDAKPLHVLGFSRWELTCCRTLQETNVGMTVWLSQLLFFQIQSCCPPPVPPVLSFSRIHLLAAP